MVRGGECRFGSYSAGDSTAEYVALILLAPISQKQKPRPLGRGFY